MSDESEFGDADYPVAWRDADRRSLSGQGWYLCFIRIELVLACAVALASDLWEPPESGRIAWVVFGWLLTMMFVQVFSRIKHHDAKWFGKRALAESLKTLTWRYMMKVHPFDQDEQDDDPADKLANNEWNKIAAQLLKESDKRHGRDEKITDIEKAGDSTDVTITPRMVAVRKLEWKKRRAVYIVDRLVNQIVWYALKSNSNDNWAEICLCLSFIVEVIAAAIALRLAHVTWMMWLFPNRHINFVPFLTTIAASIIAFAQAKRFDELKESYRMACEELVQIVRDWVIPADAQDDFIEGVLIAENAISREHTMWAAKSPSSLLWRAPLGPEIRERAQAPHDQ